MQNKKTSKKTLNLAVLGIFSALIFLMAFTPLGKIPSFATLITIVQVPVVIGAMLLGPAAGAVLGGVFGLAMFIQGFMGDPLGALMMSANPFYTFIVCMIPRILTGFLSGWIFKAIQKIDKTKIISFVTASLSCAVLNTIFFLGFLYIFFANTALLEYAQSVSMSVWNLILAIITGNAILEAAACCILGTIIGKALFVAAKRLGITGETQK